MTFCGKTVIITGAAVGIGYATAVKFFFLKSLCKHTAGKARLPHEMRGVEDVAPYKSKQSARQIITTT